MKQDKREKVHLGGIYRLMVGEGLNFKVMRREGPFWRVIWLNGARTWDNLCTAQITVCSRLLKSGSPVNAYPE